MIRFRLPPLDFAPSRSPSLGDNLDMQTAARWFAISTLIATICLFLIALAGCSNDETSRGARDFWRQKDRIGSPSPGFAQSATQPQEAGR